MSFITNMMLYSRIDSAAKPKPFSSTYDASLFDPNGVPTRELVAMYQCLSYAVAYGGIQGWDGGNDDSYTDANTINGVMFGALRIRLRAPGQTVNATGQQINDAFAKQRDMDGPDGFILPNGNPNFAALDLDRLIACFQICWYVEAVMEYNGHDDRDFYNWFMSDILGPLYAELERRDPKQSR